MTNAAPQLIAEADRAVAAGNLARARECLTAVVQQTPGESSPWLKLAAVERAAGQPRSSLDALNQALAISPLDFTALLMKASLLDRLQDPSAAEAWGHALAQKPDGELPPQMQQVLAHGEKVHAEWLKSRMQRVEAATAKAEAEASPEESHSIARFRTNALRKTRPYHSEPTHYHFPGLREREFHPRSAFPWLAELEAATATILSEFQASVASERSELAPYIQYEEHQPLAQWRALNKNPDWTAIHLLKNGERIEANAVHCPETVSLLSKLPQPQIPGASPNAMFSLLRPHTHIPPHVGIANTRLVCHLPLIVPEGCWFRVGAETRYWRRGEAFVFDDTIEHEAMNPTDELRVVFIFDVWHPDLSDTEQQAVAALIGSEGAADVGL